ncbi:MAG: hypothetical protein ACOYOA_03790, partial [Saprospiraceae bacterium]
LLRFARLMASPFVALRAFVALRGLLRFACLKASPFALLPHFSEQKYILTYHVSICSTKANLQTCEA